MADTLSALARRIDGLNEVVGRFCAWFMVPVVLIAFSVVMMRYGFSKGFIWLQETFVWLHGMAFMASAAWVLREEGHVRVDVLSRRWSERTRAWVEIWGIVVFLWPMTLTIAYWGWPAVKRSWSLLEKSPSANGLEYVYILK